ncbi:MAG: carboxylating nicotinate-nucleotide diphosphorylase [Clostridia bacterium]|nr:carboxylating nicotinate-nucleotide diphosphorylase [Clostridia bacterium]
MTDPVTLALNADQLIKAALREDISTEDISTNAVMRGYKKGKADLICKQDGVICGLKVFERVFKILDPDTEIRFFAEDGEKVTKTQHIAEVTGDIRVILQGERTALNFLQRMSGIATYTAEVAALLKGSKTKLLDTRKTTPNMRLFEKYAVRCGGGNNHRYNLSDGVMLKDNHIGAAGGIAQAVKAAKEYSSFVRKIEVEVESLAQCEEALAAGADIIMLDNMSVEDMKKAVKLVGGKALTECSGNVTRENIKNIISTEVDYVSSGALTHSAPILDLSLKNLKPLEE